MKRISIYETLYSISSLLLGFFAVVIFIFSRNYLWAFFTGLILSAITISLALLFRYFFLKRKPLIILIPLLLLKTIIVILSDVYCILEVGFAGTVGISWFGVFFFVALCTAIVLFILSLIGEIMSLIQFAMRRGSTYD